MVYRTFFIFVRKVIYLKKITADFAVSTMFKALKLLLDCIIGSCKQER